MASRDTGKQRASRIPLDYFKRPNRLERGKLCLAAVAAVVAVGWWALGSLWKPGEAAVYSPGPVASVHAIWENKCSACHVDFQPIRDGTAASYVPFIPLTSKLATRKCMLCHTGAAHHGWVQSAEALACSKCHQDHHGRDARLTQIADRNCTECHADIGPRIPIDDAHSPQEMSPPPVDVSDFELNHPNFRSIKNDPGHIKFSHRVHMTAGLSSGPDDRRQMTLADLNSADRERYRQPGQKDGEKVQLNCGACHQLDSGDLPLTPGPSPASGEGRKSVAGAAGAAFPPRAAGKRMLPIVYENQCRACHPLTIDPETVKQISDYPPGSPELMPHGLRAAQMKTLVDNYAAQRVLSADPKLLERPVPVRPVPGQEPPPGEVETRALYEKAVRDATVHLQKVCAKCHEYAQPTVDGLSEVVASQIPQVWYQHAEFSHASHRAVNCRDCHERAFADSANPSAASADVLIPDRDTCLKCHSRPHDTSAGPAGGARFDCVECHRYHNRDNPAAGIGARDEAPEETRSIEKFLSGVHD